VGARCYNVRYVNGILNISFCVHRGCALCARLYAQGIFVDERDFGNITKEIV